MRVDVGKQHGQPPTARREGAHGRVRRHKKRNTGDTPAGSVGDVSRDVVTPVTLSMEKRVIVVWSVFRVMAPSLRAVRIKVQTAQRGRGATRRKRCEELGGGQVKPRNRRAEGLHKENSRVWIDGALITKVAGGGGALAGTVGYCSAAGATTASARAAIRAVKLYAVRADSESVIVGAPGDNRAKRRQPKRHVQFFDIRQLHPRGRFRKLRFRSIVALHNGNERDLARGYIRPSERRRCGIGRDVHQMLLCERCRWSDDVCVIDILVVEALAGDGIHCGHAPRGGIQRPKRTEASQMRYR